MTNQLCLFPEEANYLSEKVLAKHYRPTGEIVYFRNLFVNRRGELFSNKTGYWRTLKPTYHQGYMKFRYNKGNYQVHRIVACTFLHNNNREEKTQIDHIDGNKVNNHIFNLEWVTHSQNQKRKKGQKDKRQTALF